MRRRAHIELTPMLDIILLLVFGFMFIIASTTTLLSEKEQDLSEKESTLEVKETELAEQLGENDTMLKELNQIIEDYNITVETLKNKNEKNELELDQLKSAMQNYFDLNESEIDDVINKSKLEDKSDLINKYTDKEKTAYSVVMYELLANEFYFIDIVINGPTNRIKINDQLTPITISQKDMRNFASKNVKMNEIKNEISKVIDGRVGGSSMTFITLSTDNDEVLHYAWSTSWQSIKQLQEKYGAKNYYCAELFIN